MVMDKSKSKKKTVRIGICQAARRDDIVSDQWTGSVRIANVTTVFSCGGTFDWRSYNFYDIL